MLNISASKFARAALVFTALLLAGCNETLEDIAPKAQHQLPEKIVRTMKAKGMTVHSPIMMRIFKEEGVLEVWKQKDTGRFDKIASYDICKWSGKLGPKFTEGDRQAPEGFYAIGPAQMNPNSSYYLSFNIGYPNAYDRAHGRTGSNLMVHGACSSAGCYSMTDDQVADIYAFARDAFAGGQQAFQLQAFPFRMTAENMARYRGDPNYEFWTMLKKGYDYFEITKTPPKVDVCDGHYVFNQIAEPGHEFDPRGACPPTTQPQALQMAYQSYQTKFEAAYSSILDKGDIDDPDPSIAGMREAALVADWSRRRARGEKVTREPPSLASVAAQKSAAEKASRLKAAAKAGAETAKAEAEPKPADDAAQEQAAQSAAVAATEAPLPAPSPRQAEPQEPAKTTSALGRLRNLFGG